MIAKTSEMNTTFSSVCAPQITRDITSVDWTVVPIQWPDDGEASWGNLWPPDWYWSKS